MTYRFLSPAQEELAHAMDYYEPAVPGLGLEFLDEVERTVSRILLQPEAWKPVFEHHRSLSYAALPLRLDLLDRWG